MFSQRGGGERIYISICTRKLIDKIYGNLVSFIKNHLSCRVRIILSYYIQVTLHPVKSKTPSLVMILNTSSIYSQGLASSAGRTVQNVFIIVPFQV